MKTDIDWIILIALWLTVMVFGQTPLYAKFGLLSVFGLSAFLTGSLVKMDIIKLKGAD